MSDRLIKRIELVANVAIVVVACLLAAAVVRTYFLDKPVATAQPVSSPAAQNKLLSAGIDWSHEQRTLILALSTTCHFCSESAPFYRKLIAEKRYVRFIAVLPQSVGDGRDYLKGLGLVVDEVKQLPLNDIGVRGTPTLILTDGSGTVQKSWIGKLRPDEESSVLGFLRDP